MTLVEHAARLRQWLRTHPLALDALIAVSAYAAYLCAAGTISKDPMDGTGLWERDLPAHSVLLGALACAALVLRRRIPTQVLGTTLAVSVVELTLGAESHQLAERHASILMPVVVALFTVASRTDRPTTWRVGLCSIAVVAPAVLLLGQQPWYSQETVGAFAWLALAAVAGEAVRSRRAMVDAIRERAERAERTREEEARRRVTEERMRIARELHDVVAHHIALVNVQAGVASHVMDSRPDQAKEALAHIRQASRRALGELQTTVGLLRQQDEPVAPTEPARGLAVLGDLVDGFVRTGMSVTVDERVDDRPLPSAVDLAAYRVVQEALTNVHKHAGHDASALVRIVCSGDEGAEALDITVLDNGDGRRAGHPHGVAGGTGGAGTAGTAGGAGANGTAALANGTRIGSGPDAGTGAAADPAAGGSGHGLVGMRERAAALSGSCEAGPLDGGGFRVRVRLPLRPPRQEQPAAVGVAGAVRGGARAGVGCRGTAVEGRRA
ncbi:sensor histidine kinase [Streptomyces sp. 4N509B]|uniref:sensor histidine kinase n=1 Tax=Streptomyces sp. 4N509B TaxID=3457413 RepID=UPI003FD09DD5